MPGYELRPVKGGYAVFEGNDQVSTTYETYDRGQGALERKQRVAKRSQRKMRNCMCCLKEFLSEGIHNRLCCDCARGGDDRQSYEIGRLI